MGPKLKQPDILASLRVGEDTKKIAEGIDERLAKKKQEVQLGKNRKGIVQFRHTQATKQEVVNACLKKAMTRKNFVDWWNEVFEKRREEAALLAGETYQIRKISEGSLKTWLKLAEKTGGTVPENEKCGANLYLTPEQDKEVKEHLGRISVKHQGFTSISVQVIGRLGHVQGHAREQRGS